MNYGGNKTIHGTGHVDVEVDENGNVVSVWYRCLMLPFQMHKVSEERANDMKRAYENPGFTFIESINIE